MIVFAGGIVRTMDPARPVARSLVVDGDRIVALDEEPAGARRVDLGGGCLLPGFTDAHVHFPTWAVTRRELQLHGTRSREEVLARVAEAAPRVPRGRWLRGFGWTADGWEPSREALDAVSGDVPVALLAHDWHSLWVNSAALAHAGGDLERPGGVVDLEARRPARGGGVVVPRPLHGRRRTRRWSRPRARRCRWRPPAA